MLPPTTLASAALRDTEWFHVAYTLPYERYLPLRTELLRPLAPACARLADTAKPLAESLPPTVVHLTHPIAMAFAMVAVAVSAARGAQAPRDPAVTFATLVASGVGFASGLAALSGDRTVLESPHASTAVVLVLLLLLQRALPVASSKAQARQATQLGIVTIIVLALNTIFGLGLAVDIGVV